MQNNNHLLVSVVMNCYNSDKYLQEALESILKQTYENFEIIFWDNKSTDKSAEIIQSFNDSRIKYFLAPNFTLLGEARNLAIEKCNGKWIGFLDCDDIYDKNKILYSMQELSKSKFDDISLIYTKTKIINERGIKIDSMDKHYSGYIHDKLLKEGDFLSLSSIMIKKDIFYHIGKINTSLNYCEDYDLLLKISKISNVIGVNEYLTYYRKHSGNITAVKYKTNIIELNNFLLSYIKENNIDLIIGINIIWKLIFNINMVSLKLIKEFKFKELIYFIKNYKLYTLFLPLSSMEYIIRKIIMKYISKKKNI
jgi:glycosyltransferase involved in cell wall biosynthesis